MAGTCWAVYILLTQHVGDRFTGIKALSLTIPVAAATAAVFGIPQASGNLSWTIAAAGVGLALLLPVLPFALEMLALRHNATDNAHAYRQLPLPSHTPPHRPKHAADLNNAQDSQSRIPTRLLEVSVRRPTVRECQIPLTQIL
jgi:hypothetical protein